MATNFDDIFCKLAEACVMDVLQAAKPKLLKMYGKVEPNIKDDSTPVTELDKELEAELREALIKFAPDVGIEGEELGKSGNSKTFWLIDPIDGTESFTRGLPFVRNMVTLIDDGEPIFSLIYKPIEDDLFIAIKGKGACKNGLPIKVSKRPLNRAWIELSAPLGPDTWPVVSAVRAVINGYRVIGDFTLVAEGKLDGQLIYKSGGGPWDYASRALLIREAGGKVANLGSRSYNYKNQDLLAANPIIFDALMQIIDTSLA